MELNVTFIEPGKADGVYRLKAPGCAAALLSWADENGSLDAWMAFSYIPLDSWGRGVFHFQGGRAIPPEAAYIHVRAVSDDLLHCEEKLFPIMEGNRNAPVRGKIRLCVMSDLHLSSKSGAVKRALQGVGEADALLLAGDMTNDGTKEQFQLLKECLQNTVPKMKIFPVIGNHDIPRTQDENTDSYGVSNYTTFQKWVCENRKDNCMEEYIQGPDSAYAVRKGTVEIIGLQAVTDERKFLFEDGRQLVWLDRHLGTVQDIRWHVIICHAPLLQHNPKREAGKEHPYLNRDKQLQEIVDRHGSVIFLSGHTHLSMDNLKGCVEWDAEHENIYVNDGSIRPTDLLPNELIQPEEWKSGTRLDITIGEEEVEIITRSVKDGKKHARGYYRIWKK